MRRFWIGTCLSLLLPGLASAEVALPREGWARYSVPMATPGDGPCCYELRGAKIMRRGCDLDRSGGPRIDRSAPADSPLAARLDVYLHFGAGDVDRVAAYSGDCPVHSRTPPVELDMSESRSIDWLQSLARRAEGSEDLREGATLALAQHAHDHATTALVALADDPALALEVRRDAVFWLGQNRGPSGARAVERIARSNAPSELREHAVFALSQLEQGADAALIAVVQGDYPRKLKKTALFWLGQSGSDDALAFLDGLLSASAAAASTTTAAPDTGPAR